MSRISDILVATDFSPRAELAVTHAARLAQHHKAVLHMLHVLPTLAWQMFGRALVEHPLVTEAQLFESAAKRLRALAEAQQAQTGGSVRHHVVIGRTHEEIAGYVHAHPIDLLVLGAHGENFVHDLFIGGTATKVLRATAHPTLIVRSGASMNADYRHLLVPVDFSAASRLALTVAARIAPQAAIQVLHVYEAEFESKMQYAGVDEAVIQQYRDAAAQEAQRIMERFLHAMEGHERMSPLVMHGSPASIILSQAEALRPDLVVMGKRGHSELDEMLLGSVTKHVLEESDRDVLLVAPDHTGTSGNLLAA